MKSLLSIAILVVLAFPFAGCSLVPGYDKAVQAYEASKDDFAKTSEAFEKAAADVKTLQASYSAALAQGDTTRAEALLKTLPEALSKLENLKAASDSAMVTFNKAKQQLEDADSAQDYIGTILGLLGAALTGGIGGNVLGRRTAKAKT